MTVLVLGATGQIGALLVRLLQGERTPVRILARDIDRAKTLFVSSQTDSYTEVLGGNLSDSATLGAAMTDIEQIFVSMGVITEEEKAIQRTIIDAAARKKVNHFVRVSVLSASHGSRGRAQRAHANIETYLEDSGLTHTSLRPAIFDSTLLGYAKEIAREGGWIGSAPNSRNPFVSPEDVSAAALAVLLNPSTRNENYELTGPDLLTYSDVAAVISSLIKRQVEYRAVSTEEHRKILLGRGMDTDWADVIVTRDLAGEANENARISSSIYDLTGREPQSLSEFLNRRTHLLNP